MDVQEVKERAEPRAFGPRDDLPREYREAATRMIQFHANSEIMGAYIEKPFIRKAPSLERKLAFSAQVQDEMGHGQLLYRAAESLGVKTRDEMLDELERGDGKFLNCFHYPLESWIEVPMIMFFVDGAAMCRQATLKQTSWTPYAHAIDKICFEEGFHIKQGESVLRELATGSRSQQERLQAAFEEWWPRILQFFGPTDEQSAHTDFSMDVGLKTMSNDDLRNNFLNKYVPKAERYGLELPDEPRVRYDEENGRYEVEEDDLNWEEFKRVSQNEYEGSKAQLDGRRQAKDAVAWAREGFNTGDAPVGGDES